MNLGKVIVILFGLFIIGPIIGQVYTTVLTQTYNSLYSDDLSPEAKATMQSVKRNADVSLGLIDFASNLEIILPILIVFVGILYKLSQTFDNGGYGHF